MLKTGRAIRSTLVVAAAVLFTLLGSSPALARDKITQLDLAQALATPDAKANLDGSVKFYFGQAAHPQVSKHLGEAITNKKANGFGRSDTRGCDRAFVDAMIRLQRRAKDLGGDAVININTYNKKDEVVIDKTVECRSGFLMDGVTLKGEVVKLAS
jgi:uncharacterized protein YbjQ (UPF0145 family)